jgi:hypothetical protein
VAGETFSARTIFNDGSSTVGARISATLLVYCFLHPPKYTFPVDLELRTNVFRGFPEPRFPGRS